MSEEVDVLAALKQWGEMAYEGDPIADVLLNDISRAVDRIQGLEDVLEEKRSAVNGLRSALDTSQARLSEAVKVLEPFVRYLDEYRFDIDNNGNPLPDETRPGWTYLTAGDFRAAKAFLATLGEENE